MLTLDAARQQRNLALLAAGREFSFDDAGAAQLPPGRLAALDVASPGVEGLIDGSPTARVFELSVQGRRSAVLFADRV